MKRIHDSLSRVLQAHRLVFWYDAEGQWREAFDSLEAPGLRKRVVAGDEFGVKVALHRAAQQDERWLLYFPSPRPPDEANWLLDLLLQGHEYKADRTSLALQEAGLPYVFQPVVDEHLKFFDATKRIDALRARVQTDDDEHALRRNLMAVLLNEEPVIDALLMRLLSSTAPDEVADPVEARLGAYGLSGYFWVEVKRAFGYASAAPTLRDFAITLFRSDDPLDNSAKLNTHARVFMQQWQDSRVHSAAFRQWSAQLQAELRIEDRLEDQDDARVLGQADTYELFERFTLSWLCQAFMARTPDDAALRVVIDARVHSFWSDAHADGYAAVAQALALRELIDAAEIKMGSVESGLTRYAERWHRVDTAYRKFCLHQRRYGQAGLFEKLVAWVEKAYVNGFLLPLSERWGDVLRALPNWPAAGVPTQRGFFDRCVRPFTAKKQKVFVVISDALRFEAAAEFVTRLRAENRWTAELEATLGVLPSYTQLGMAALLPGDALAINPADTTVSLDGRSTAGLPARQDILGAAENLRATAVRAAEFLQMNSKTDARTLLREHDAVFIYHDAIDAVGDDMKTEGNTADAVERAFDELLQIVRKIYAANGYNIIVTADHGFLFQQGVLNHDDDQPLPRAGEWLYTNRRYALGRGIDPDPAVKTFSAAELGLRAAGPGAADWQAAFPLTLGRFPKQGAGKRYVHGGLSLQEIVVPVIHAHVARSDDTASVEVELLRPPSRITSITVPLSLYQSQPVADKLLPRTLRAGVYAQDGTPLSETRTLTFDSTDPEARLRETTLTLTLSSAADAYANQEVEIRLDETLAGTTQSTLYKRHRAKLQKRFTNDFDDL